MLSCRQRWIICRHSAVNFLAIFFYDINTKPCWIKSISLINFLGNGDDVRKSQEHTEKQFSYRGGGGGGGGGVTTQLEMCTEVMLDKFLLDRLYM